MKYKDYDNYDYFIEIRFFEHLLTFIDFLSYSYHYYYHENTYL